VECGFQGQQKAYLLPPIIPAESLAGDGSPLFYTQKTMFMYCVTRAKIATRFLLRGVVIPWVVQEGLAPPEIFFTNLTIQIMHFQPYFQRFLYLYNWSISLSETFHFQSTIEEEGCL
jgi:hypothetical protein